MVDDKVLKEMEVVVCDAVNEVFEVFKPDLERAVAGGLYSRKGRVPMAMNEARRFCVLVMKDSFHLSSSEIGRRTGLTVGAVKKILRKVRYDSWHDPLSFAIRSEITKRCMFLD